MGVVRLSEELEHSVLSAIISGLVPRTTAKEEELSKLGRWVLKAITYLSDRQHNAPYAYASIFGAVVDILGADAAEIRPYLKDVEKAGSGIEAQDLLMAVRNKQTLVGLINAAGEQLSSGKLDIGHLTTKLKDFHGSNDLVPAIKALENGAPKMPEGLCLPGLDRLMDATGGVYGFWVIGGKPGLGKSTLALQIATLATKHRPVIYYDYENGQAVMLARLGTVFSDDRDSLLKLTERLYFRESIRSLDADLLALGTESLVVVDSIQKLPTSVLHRRVSLDQWIHKLEGLKKQGHVVLAVSELNRQAYDFPGLSGFKESGEIEFAVDVALQLQQTKYDQSILEVHLEKNRHRKARGMIGEITRVNDWWFNAI